jgi:hypothetical protein
MTIALRPEEPGGIKYVSLVKSRRKDVNYEG